MALYNTTYYNADQYNLTADLLSLSDSVASADVLTKDVFLPRQDSMAEVDTIGQNIGPDEIMDMIAMTENRTSSILFPREEMLVLSEALVTLLDLSALLETISMADALTTSTQAAYFDLLFVEDPNFVIEISNKALSDTVRLADWLSIERTPSVDGWGG